MDVPPCEVYECNRSIFETWAAAWPRWRWVPLGLAGADRGGLDVAQVESVLRLRGVDPQAWPAIFDGLLIMESEALAALAEKQK